MKEKNSIILLEIVERYILGEMNPDERMHFEQLRKSDVEIDQMVVEHTLFLQKMNRFNEWNKFSASLETIHTHLSEEGKITAPKLKGKAKIIYLFEKYKKTAAIAASIAGITALTVSAAMFAFSSKNPESQLIQLKTDLNQLANKTIRQDAEIYQLKNQTLNASEHKNIAYTKGGTSFVLDSRGYLVTNYHVIENAQNIAVQNSSGKEFKAVAIYSDPNKDLAILKITDSSFKELASIPYGFSKKTGDLAEPIFTLGYPKEEIVYGQGYLSSRTGYNGDTLSCQIEIAANRGNSGSPILNSHGDIIGILNGRQKDLVGFTFAIQASNIFSALKDIKSDNNINDSLLSNIKLSAKSSIADMNRTQQVKKLQDYIFMVKVN